MRNILLLIGLALAGCQTDQANVYGSLVGQNIVGNEAYVTVSNVWNEMDALPLADRHCGQFKKIARFTRMEGHRAIFDCVQR